MSHLGVQLIISGGQTGVDQGALWAAKQLKIDTGGWVPVGGMTTEGKNPKLVNEFGCKEISDRGKTTTIINN